MEGKYNIGEIAGIMGISAELLRHYERKGIIVSSRDKNGYRYYSLDTVKKLTGVRRSRAFGFSLEEAERLLVSNSHEETVTLHRRRLWELERELWWQEQIREALKALIEELEYIVEEVGVCRLTETQAVFRYNFQHNRGFSPSGPDHLRWQERMPVVSISPGFSLNAVKAGSDDCDFGYVVPLEQGKLLGLDGTAGTVELLGGIAVTTVISSKGAEHIRAAQMQSALAFAQGQDLRAVGDVWGITIHNFDGVKYHRMYLPVMENEL